MEKEKKNKLKAILIPTLIIGLGVYLAYRGGRNIVRKRIVLAAKNDIKVIEIVDKATNRELADLFHYFESVRLKVKFENVPIELQEIITKISLKYNYDLTQFANGK